MQITKKGPFILVFCTLIFVFFLIGCARVAETPSTLNVFENAPLDTTQIAVSTVTIGGVAVTREVISNQVIITLSSGKTESNLTSALPAGYTIVGRNSLTNAYQVQIPSGKTLADAKTEITNLNLGAVDSNQVVYVKLAPNESIFSDTGTAYAEKLRTECNDWGFTKIQALDAWDITTGESSVTVAVIDTGLDTSHPEFSAARITYKHNFIDDSASVNSTNVEDDWGHGTAVAGILAAAGNNSQGLAGMNWYCKLMLLRAFKKAASGGTTYGISDSYALCNAIGYAVGEGAKIINCSFGIEYDPASATDLISINRFKDILAVCKDYGVLLVAAAGNENKSAGYTYPGALSSDSTYGDYVINVGGTDRNDSRWRDSPSVGSNYGSAVNVSAPSTLLYSSYINDDYSDYLWGTSLAAPFVSGLASLMKTVYSAMTPKQMKEIVCGTAYTDAVTTDSDKPIGRRINALKAISRAQELAALAVPAITTVVPSSGNYGSTAGDTTTISGSNFLTGAIVKIGDYTCTDVSVSTTYLTCKIPNTVPPGTYSLTVRNTNGNTGFKTDAYTVSPAVVVTNTGDYIKLDNGKIWVKINKSADTRTFIDEMGFVGKDTWLGGGLQNHLYVQGTDTTLANDKTVTALANNSSAVAGYKVRYTSNAPSITVKVSNDPPVYATYEASSAITTWKIILDKNKDYVIWQASFEAATGIPLLQTLTSTQYQAYESQTDRNTMIPAQIRLIDNIKPTTMESYYFETYTTSSVTSIESCWSGTSFKPLWLNNFSPDASHVITKPFGVLYNTSLGTGLTIGFLSWPDGTELGQRAFGFPLQFNVDTKTKPLSSITATISRIDLSTQAGPNEDISNFFGGLISLHKGAYAEGLALYDDAKTNYTTIINSVL